MLPQNKDQVLLQNAAPPECPPQVFSQFVDSPPPNLASLSPHQTLPSSHLPLPTTTQAYFFSPLTQTLTPGPHIYSSDSNSDFAPLLYSSRPRSSPSPHSTSPSKYQVCPSPPLTRSSSLSQLQSSSPHSYQSSSCLQDFQSSTITSPSPTSPSPEIPSTEQAWQGPPSRSIRSSGVAGGCVPSKVAPAEFKDIEALTQALVDHVGHHRIQGDLKLELLQRMWLGTTGPAPVLEYPICLVCLQLRTPSCPTSKYKTIPRLLAFPKLCVQGLESGCLQMGIGFSLHLSRRQAKDLHLLLKKCPTGVESQEEASHSQKPASQASVISGTSFQAGSLQSVDLQSPKPSQCSRSLLQETRQATASPKPRSSVSKRSVPLKSILRKSSS
ncbi:proline-rich protein 30-like [Arvicanthis niloticus]|uniref:proline-rich protein 30-like n=1 Tax=Arvicanthis niloticus TaxID=61156 RepID=UPI0014864367|nr:proline-rich protein 30-like [Arvicanthis niloticus]XP_034369666.1 proline-rich protein 30-like [Arvicanthis niloticus]XP_034369667.1 proline-rich protein 30-like [Arvicanthis niloticus]XP_034369668.1 proline-rich protein 30-like [Arvicanthis niloticus]